MSYQINIDPKKLAIARVMAQFTKVVQKAFSDSELTQQQLAEKMEINRSVVNRRLKTKANLTTRSLAELAIALDKELKFELVDKPDDTVRVNFTRTNEGTYFMGPNSAQTASNEQNPNVFINTNEKQIAR